MQPKNTNIAVIIGAMFLGASGASQAASESFDITVTTLADVAVTEVAPLDFGANILAAAGGTCVMAASTAATITDDKLQIVRDVPVAAMTDYGDLSGSGCITGAGTDLGTQPGEYLLSGSSGTDITILVSAVDAGDYTFTPAGFASNYDGAGVAADLPEAVVSGTSLTTTLADAAETDVVAGELVMVLGGTLAIVNTLAADTAFNATTFPLNVVY